jgi:FMN phosphatase YigB (HAD superfamily)
MSARTAPVGPPAAILTEINGILTHELWRRAAERLAEETGVDHRNIMVGFNNRRRAFERAGEDLETFFRGVALDADLSISLERFQTVLLKESIEPIPANVEFLRERRAKDGVRLYALSNIPGPVYEVLDERLGLADLFDDSILSFREQIAKPNAQVYIEAIDLVGGSPAEMLYLDIGEEEIGAAGEWGIPSLLVEDPLTLPQLLAPRFGLVVGAGRG